MKYNKNKNHKRLSRKFITSFFVPFLIGTIISILYVIFIFSVSPTYINSKEDLKKILREKEFKKTLPLILSSLYSINNAFQLYINNIVKLSEFYKYNSPKLVNQVSDNEKLKFINKFTYNGVNEDQIKKFHNLFYKYNNNIEYLYNQGRWFVNLTKIDLEINNDKKIIHQIYALINLLPLLKTILKITNIFYQQANVNNQILIMFSETELFFKYPIVQNYMYGSDLKALYHTADCKTKNEQYPHYYYFKCRPYYSFLIKEVSKGHNVSISDIYKFVNGNFGITICIQFKDVIDDKKDYVSICHDMEIGSIHQQLDSINNKIPGYIFLIRVGSEVPIYYPQIIEKNYENIANMEFSIKNEYYNDEISLFIKNISTIVAEYKYNRSNTDIVSFDISKNNEKYNYSLFPIFFDLPDMDEPVHLLTLVYVNPYKKDYKVEYLYSTICISFVYLMMGCFLLLLCKYLIISIAKNIVRPIKIIKDLLEQDFEITTIENNEDREIYNRNTDIVNNTNNQENRNLSKSNNFVSFSNKINQENDVDEEKENLNFKNGGKEAVLLADTNNYLSETASMVIAGDGSNKLPSLFLSHKIPSKINFYDDDNESSDDDNNSSLDNDEEIDKTKYRSNNIQQLFMKLVDLKNAFKCLEDTKLSDDKLSELVHAQNVFKEINNLEASSLCESNISSLFIKSEQFDKAISHLYNGIEDINRKIFRKNHSHNKNKEIKINVDEIKKRIKNENLLNRYMKLFHCYQKYFKLIKKKYKNKSFFELNIDSFYITHHFELYKKSLDDYIFRVKEYIGGKDLCMGLLAKLEEKISFELPPFREENKYYETWLHINKNDKEKLINEIFELFKEVDKLNYNKISANNYNVVHLINLLKYDSDIVNAMDIPSSILIQKANYLKGKFHLKCYDYKMAIEYFENTLEFEKIGDIELTMKAYKYLIKISKIYLNLVNNDIEFHSHEIKYKLELKEDRQRKEILENFIINLNNEMKSYRYVPKDICIILNLGNLTKANDLNINEKISNIQKILINIFQKITTTKDRIGIMEYKDEDYRFLVTLTNKDEKNEKKINEILDNLELFLYSSFNNNNTINNSSFSNSNNNSRSNSRVKKSNVKNEEEDKEEDKEKEKEKDKNKEKGKEKEKEDTESEEKSQNVACLFNSIKHCNGYLKMKQINNSKNNLIDNWFIFITCNIEYEEINEIVKTPLNEVLFPNGETNNNLIIIFYDNIANDSKRKLKKWMKYNKNTVLTKEELSKLKEIMGTKGEQQKIIFELEKYKDKL